MNSLVPITMTEISLAKGMTYKHILPENHNGFVYVLSGEVELGESKTPLKKQGQEPLLLTKMVKTKVNLKYQQIVVQNYLFTQGCHCAKKLSLMAHLL